MKVVKSNKSKKRFMAVFKDGDKVYSQYKIVAEVSLGNPIVEVDDKRFTVTYRRL